MSLDTPTISDEHDIPAPVSDAADNRLLSAKGQAAMSEGLEDFDEMTSNPKALAAAEAALAEKGINSENQINGRRYGAEAAAIANMDGDATCLDVAGRANFPTYDASSSNEVASVKTHWAGDGSLSESARAAYQRDFAHMLGWGRMPDALNTDGKNIRKAAKQGVPVPPAIYQAEDDCAAGQYLRDNSVLRVPNDHVATVQRDLASAARQHPENYFLPENPSDEQISALIGRVKSQGLASSQLQALIDRNA